MVKRSVINLDLTGSSLFDYCYIDHIKGGSQFGGPGQTAWKTGTIWMQQIDANGWPTYSSTTRSAPLGGFAVPASTDYTGTYTIDGQGTGRINIPQSGTYTLSATSGVFHISNGTWDVVDSGSGWSAQVTYSGIRQTLGPNITRNDPGAAGSYIKNVRWYRTTDAADLAAGKIFRTAWKQSLLDLNPGAIRAMNWTGHNSAKNCRFENRTKPSYAQWSPNYWNWVASLPYGETTGTNQYTLAAVTGTPSSMQHGELATCRIGTGMARCGSGQIMISAISKANPGVVTALSHGFSTGDKIVHLASRGMTQLHYVPCTITVIDADNYSIGIDTTSFSTFAFAVTATGNSSAGSATLTGFSSTSGISAGMGVFGSTIPAGVKVADKTSTTVILTTGVGVTAGTGISFSFSDTNARQYISLQVGSGSDRTDYPVVFANGTSPASTFSNVYMATGDYKTFYFDKTQAAKADTAGVWSYGVWIFNDLGSDLGHAGGTPLEVCVALVNELMAMTTRGPIDLWITIPHWAMLSMDPDYSAASNFAVGAVDVCLNGANGYSGLHASCKLLVEYSNETWNTAGAGWYQTPYLARRGFLRWGGSTTDYASMVGLRSFIMCQDILAAGFPRARYKLVMAGQGTLGISAGTMNYLRVNGSTNMLTDALNPVGATPMSLHDYFAWAAYLTIDPAVGGGSWETTNLASIVASWVSHAGDAVAQEADCAAYVAGFENTGTSGNETVYRYRDLLLPAYATALGALGKTTIMYEGGWDRAITGGSADQNNFLIAVKKSRAWARKLRSFFDAFDNTASAEYPSDYILLNSRWGHLSPDSYTNAVGGVEWSGVDLAWKLAALRNQGKRQFVIRF